ncbi:YgjV family protein [Photobacterium sagamiensis]|uniref:YgjV family protein n=1 Tax=Photobacterium sagamiensis TaxID=2910241 RepID=UPI003D0D5C62
MSAFILSQIVIGFAACFDLFSFQFKERHKIVRCFVIAVSLISLHFVLLEQWTAAGLMALAAIRYITSLFTTSKKVVVLFSLSSLIVTYVTYAGYISLISCAASLFQNAAAFSKEDKQLRQFMILATSCWIVHNCLIASPTAVLLEVLFITSNLVGYYRYYHKPNLKTC